MPDPSPSTLTVLNSNFLQLGRRSGGRPQRTVYTRRLPVNTDTHYFSRPRTHNLPIVSSIESIKNCKPVGELDRALLSFKQPTRPHRTATPSVDRRSDPITETAFTGCACELTGGAAHCCSVASFVAVVIGALVSECDDFKDSVVTNVTSQSRGVIDDVNNRHTVGTFLWIRTPKSLSFRDI